jgi:hypothetical protein
MAGAAMLAMSGTASGQATGPLAPVVEPARQITADPNPGRLYVIPTIAVSPKDPDTVVIAAGDAANGGCSLHASRDGGLSWAMTARNFMPAHQPFCVQRNAGPALSLGFASDGTLHIGASASSITAGHPNGPIDALSMRTADLGTTVETSLVEKAEPFTWTTQAGVQRTDPVSLAQNSVAVDPKNPNLVYRSYRFRIRASEEVANRPLVVASTDGGKTWGKPVDPLKSFTGPVFGADVPVLVVGQDGTIYGFTEERVAGTPRPPQRMFMFKSTDRGATWSTTPIAGDANLMNPPGVAIDPRNGNLYVVYQGQAVGTPNSKVFFLASTDGGKTWTKPMIPVDDGPPRNSNQYYPGVSVAPNGRVDIAWHDFRHDPFSTTAYVPNVITPNTERWSDVYYAYSTDGGATWSKNLRITDRSIDRNAGATFNGRDVRGLIGIASTDAAVYVTWPDTRAAALPTLDVEDAYFTRVRFDTGKGATTEEGVDLLSVLIGGGAALGLAGLVLAGWSSGRRGTPD